MPEPQVSLEEQSSVHPGPVTRHLPASPHYPVPLRRQDGNAGRQRVLPRFHGELDQEDQTDHKPVQRRQRANVRGELSTQVSFPHQVSTFSAFISCKRPKKAG